MDTDNENSQSADSQVGAYSRRLAEEQSPRATDDVTLKLVQELEIHQIELEMQNAELHKAQSEFEVSRNRYAELYDFAPVAYFTFDAHGQIREVNLTGARLLGIERQQLLNKLFSRFIADEEGRDIFSRHLGFVLQNHDIQRCEFKLTGKEGSEIHGQIQSVLVDSVEKSEPYILSSIVDGTVGKQLEAEIQDARKYAESIVETVREPLVVLNADLKILTANLSFYDIFKVTPKETIGHFIYDIGNRQWDIPRLRTLFEEIFLHDTVFNGYEVDHEFQNIGHKIILLNARQIFREKSGSRIILLAMEDVTDRRLLEAEIQDARKYAENIVETVREPLVVLNSDLKILIANHSFYETFMVMPVETIGHYLYDLGNRQWDIPQLRVLFEDILPHNTVINGYEVDHDFPGIGHKIILLNARQIFRKNIDSHIILLAMEDITVRKEMEVSLRHGSTHDLMTGLYNRAFFDEELERLSHSRMFPLSIVMADINGLKRTNDSQGHEAGDVLIRLAARIILNAFRAEDIVARYGGDEFAVLLPGTAGEIAKEAVERIMKYPECSDGRVSIAFGIASAENRDQLADALRLSDELMYQHKAAQKES